jgi:hypothetical protein
MSKKQEWNRHYDNKEHFRKQREYYPRWRLSEHATERLCFFMFGILVARLLEILARMQCD